MLRNSVICRKVERKGRLRFGCFYSNFLGSKCLILVFDVWVCYHDCFTEDRVRGRGVFSLDKWASLSLEGVSYKHRHGEVWRPPEGPYVSVGTDFSFLDFLNRHCIFTFGIEHVWKTFLKREYIYSYGCRIGCSFYLIQQSKPVSCIAKVIHGNVDYNCKVKEKLSYPHMGEWLNTLGCTHTVGWGTLQK